MTQQEQDFAKVHYRPHGNMDWCGAVGRALDDKTGNRPWSKIKLTTDVSRVTCPACQHRIKVIIRGW